MYISKFGGKTFWATQSCATSSLMRIYPLDVLNVIFIPNSSIGISQLYNMKTPEYRHLLYVNVHVQFS